VLHIKVKVKVKLKLKVKLKVRLSLCLTKHHAMKKYWGSRGTAPRILKLGTSQDSSVV